jgi:hypothetical protein
MRDFKDCNGLKLRLLSVSGEDTFEGLLEGSPYMVRKFRIHGGRKWMDTPGHYCPGLDELEREIATLDRDHGVWPPRYGWTATLVTGWDQDGWRGCLTVRWYDEIIDDPLSRLQEILSGIDFSSSCVKEQSLD